MRPFPFPNQHQNQAQYGNAVNQYYAEQAAAHHYYEEQKKKKFNQLMGQKDRIFGDPQSGKYSLLEDRRKYSFLSENLNREQDQKPTIYYPRPSPASTYTSSYESEEGWPKWIVAVIIIAIALILIYIF